MDRQVGGGWEPLYSIVWTLEHVLKTIHGLDKKVQPFFFFLFWVGFGFWLEPGFGSYFALSTK